MAEPENEPVQPETGIEPDKPTPEPTGKEGVDTVEFWRTMARKNEDRSKDNYAKLQQAQLENANLEKQLHERDMMLAKTRLQSAHPDVFDEDTFAMCHADTVEDLNAWGEQLVKFTGKFKPAQPETGGEPENNQGLNLGKFAKTEPKPAGKTADDAQTLYKKYFERFNPTKKE